MTNAVTINECAYRGIKGISSSNDESLPFSPISSNWTRLIISSSLRYSSVALNLEYSHRP
ncbi:4461_t:CDS:2 [Entrophospora sp. SA101]|nr:4461_t:CDS:2 [Entrophospora sp. SA101]